MERLLRCPPFVRHRAIVTPQHIDAFYVATVRDLVSRGKLEPTAKTLVVAGGFVDRASLLEAGFSDVTIGNLDERTAVFEPYKWDYQDAEALDYADNQFDQVIVHSGLHHCASPHKALLEMYRVASRAVLVFEGRDSFSIKLAAKLGLTSEYELEGVVANRLAAGGLRNGTLPNYVYRWTEREVKKTVETFDPRGPINVEYFYGLRLPKERISAWRSPIKRAVAMLVVQAVAMFPRVVRTQRNEFGFWIGKPASRWPWLMGSSDEMDPTWVQKRYG